MEHLTQVVIRIKEPTPKELEIELRKIIHNNGKIVHVIPIDKDFIIIFNY